MTTEKERSGLARRSWLKKGVGAGVFLLLVGVLVLIVAGFFLARAEALEMEQSTILLDSEGQEVTRLFKKNREVVPLEEVPQYVVDAFLATEDRRFYYHFGVDPLGITRAAMVNLGKGDVSQGGSTITQQLAKNAFLSHDRTFSRKMKELAIAINLELRYSKKEILEMYFNHIFFGHGAHGLETAAKIYFGHSISEVTLSEAALLAGLPKAPNRYSPYNDMDGALQRRDVVLSLMLEQGKITEEEAEKAKAEEIALAPENLEQNDLAQDYLDYVLWEAEERFGFSGNELYQGGYKIYTNVNLAAQKAAEEVFEDPANFPDSKEDRIVQGSMVILDNRTGGILALVSGRGEDVQRGNIRALAKRQPGSSFKPVTVYGPALEEGWHPYDLLTDKPLNYGKGQEYKPRNINGRYQDKITMYDALRDSVNAPAVWLLDQISVGKGYAFANRLGMELAEEEQHNLAIALGGLTHGVSPLQMAQGYTAFANSGKKMEAFAIRKITTLDDKVVAEAHPQSQQVISEQNAYYMTRMLEDVVNEGTGKNARLPNRPVAGKTGTTEYTVDGKTIGNRDAWFVGYTPEWVAAVWMGYDRTDPEHFLRIGGGGAAKLFGTVMSKAMEGMPSSHFVRPEHVAELEPPVRLTAIEDLTGEYVPGEGMVQLRWGALSGDVGYRIYRQEVTVSWWGKWMKDRDKAQGKGKGGKKRERDDSAQEDQDEMLEDLIEQQQQDEKAGEIQLIADVQEAGYRDEDIRQGFMYRYYVVPYDRRNGREGEKSNEVEVQAIHGEMLDRSLQELFDRLNGKGEVHEEEDLEKDEEERGDSPSPPGGEDSADGGGRAPADEGRDEAGGESPGVPNQDTQNQDASPDGAILLPRD